MLRAQFDDHFNIFMGIYVLKNRTKKASGALMYNNVGGLEPLKKGTVVYEYDNM